MPFFGIMATQAPLFANVSSLFITIARHVPVSFAKHLSRQLDRVPLHLTQLFCNATTEISKVYKVVPAIEGLISFGT